MVSSGLLKILGVQDDTQAKMENAEVMTFKDTIKKDNRFRNCNEVLKTAVKRMDTAIIGTFASRVISCAEDEYVIMRQWILANPDYLRSLSA